MTHIPSNSILQQKVMTQYYSYQSKIYDATRWSFLFGRKQVLKQLKKHLPQAQNMLEIGCGTGTNLQELIQMYPDSHIWGIEGAKDMYKIAQKKLNSKRFKAHLIKTAYIKEHGLALPMMDVIVFSYVLTMINPYYKEVIEQAYKDLAPGGRIVVVDFHLTTSDTFRKWMEVNHVVMKGQLLPILQSLFETEFLQIEHAYGELWHYFMFIGKKK